MRRAQIALREGEAARFTRQLLQKRRVEGICYRPELVGAKCILKGAPTSSVLGGRLRWERSPLLSCSPRCSMVWLQSESFCTSLSRVPHQPSSQGCQMGRVSHPSWHACSWASTIIKGRGRIVLRSKQQTGNPEVWGLCQYFRSSCSGS